MKNKSIKLLLWAIFVMLLSICMRVLFIGYETPNLVIWLSFALPVVSIILAICSWISEHISDDKE
jgi:hypothetical protein